MALSVYNVTKDFRDVRAVDQLTIEVKAGSIFGFLGPNGAGKTTTIRLILDIIKPDTGSITWKGKPLSRHPLGTFGYLPEERGLYPKMRVEEHLVFLARLNGLGKKTAVEKTKAMIERFCLRNTATSALKNCPRKPAKVQTISALIHEPEILFLDEPFSGLDPVNTDLLKQLLLEGNKQGQTIIFSSHRMEQVEELCRDICILNHGKLVLSGNLQQIKEQMGRQYLHLAVDGDQDFWREFPELELVGQTPEYLVLKLNGLVDTNAILAAAFQAGRVLHFELALPTLNQIFVSKVGEAS